MLSSEKTQPYRPMTAKPYSETYTATMFLITPLSTSDTNADYG